MIHIGRYSNLMLTLLGSISKVKLFLAFRTKSMGICLSILSYMPYHPSPLIFVICAPLILHSCKGLLHGAGHLNGKLNNMVKLRIWNLPWISFSHPEHILLYPSRNLLTVINPIRAGYSLINTPDHLKPQLLLWTKRCKGFPEPLIGYLKTVVS